MTLSLAVLPQSVFGRLQIVDHMDGCLVFHILHDVRDEVGGTIGSATHTVGLTKGASDALRDFLAGRDVRAD